MQSYIYPGTPSKKNLNTAKKKTQYQDTTAVSTVIVEGRLASSRNWSPHACLPCPPELVRPRFSQEDLGMAALVLPQGPFPHPPPCQQSALALWRQGLRKAKQTGQSLSGKIPIPDL